MLSELVNKLRDWLPGGGAKPAREQPAGLALELDIARGTVRQVRARPFIPQRPDSARCIPSRQREG